MNMQAMLKQAQRMQKELLNKQAEIEKMEFEDKQTFVKVRMNGKKEILDIKINYWRRYWNPRRYDNDSN